GLDSCVPWPSHGSLGRHAKPSPRDPTWAKRGATVANPRLTCNSRNSADQSASARHSPSTSGWPARIWDSTAAISARQRAIHAASFWRSAAISSNVLPSSSSLAFWPVYSWYRRQITSAYLASNSISRLARPSRSHAISVEPDPPNRSTTRSPALLLFRRARSISSTGFMVGCRRLAAGLFSSQSVDCDLSPYQGSFCPETWA